MFISSWSGNSGEIEQFLLYFKSEYIKRNNNWFEGAASGLPSTNNATENYNKHIKDDGTLRKQEIIGHFFDNIVNFNREESIERAVGRIKI